MFKSACRYCGHSNCHGISQQLSCDSDSPYGGEILNRIWKPWCRQYAPFDNLEFIEWKYAKKESQKI